MSSDSPARSLVASYLSSEPMARITGFEVQAEVANSPTRGTPQRVKSAASMLSLNLASSINSSCKMYETDSEGCGEEEYSDDFDDECCSPNAIQIKQKDDDYYKMMLRVRAVVNARLWSSGHPAAHPQQHANAHAHH